MSRISSAGMLVALGVAAVILLELRTLMGMFGIDVGTPVYFTFMAGVLVVLAAVLVKYGDRLTTGRDASEQ